MEAEKEADVLIWDGGNNDLPFIRPGLEIVVTDPLRAGHEIGYFPGEANLIRADHVIINKADIASRAQIDAVVANIRSRNPRAKVTIASSILELSGPVAGKKALVIEDGPTLTHGGMDYGAGTIAAKKYGAIPIDLRPYAKGSIKTLLEANPRLTKILPAIGYSKEQMKELSETIESTPCDIIISATPVDLSNILEIKKPVVRVSYHVEETEGPKLEDIIDDFLKGKT